MTDDIMQMVREIADQCVRNRPPVWAHEYAMVRIMWLIAAEREACAKVCDDWPNGRDDVYSIGVAIRARGEA